MFVSLSKVLSLHGFGSPSCKWVPVRAETVYVNEARCALRLPISGLVTPKGSEKVFRSVKAQCSRGELGLKWEKNPIKAFLVSLE